jgi:hypothetical protein
MRNVLTIGAALALAACPAKSGGDRAGTGTGAMAATTDGGAPPRTIDARPGGGPIALPPAPPVPRPPAGLPALPADLTITAAEVALGELLFHEPRLGADGTTAVRELPRSEPGLERHRAPPADRGRAPEPAPRRLAVEPGLGGRVRLGRPRR